MSKKIACLSVLVSGVAPAPRERLTRAQKWSVALSLVGAIVSLPAAGLLGAALGYYPSRMDCTQETLGSGCYEGELLIASVFFAVLFVPFFMASLSVAVHHRKSARKLANWWPFFALCAVPFSVIVMFVISATANPNEYF